MELRDYIRVLRKGWYFIVGLTLVGLVAAGAYSLTRTPEYQSTTKVFVSITSTGTVSELTSGNTFALAQVKSYAEVVTTPIVLDPVIAELGLDTTSGALASSISATAPTGSVVLEITVSNPDPELAALIADSVANSFSAAVSDLVPVDAQGVSPVTISTVQQANVPTKPSSPNTPLNLALGALVGLALGVGIAVLRETLDNRVRNEHDVEEITGSPIVGGIAFDAKAPQQPLIVKVDPRSPRAESFRTLRTNLQFLNIAGRPRSFVITSSVSGEGKSTSAANLSIVTAASQTRVVIVDADLRKPKLAEYLGLEGGAGLTDILVGRAELDDVIQRWGETELFVIPAGHIPPNPSELLGSAEMTALIRTLEERFDVVFFDAPPLLPVTDAAILAKNTGGALVMVAAGRTQRGQLRGSIGALESVDAPIAGIVMTMMPTKGPDSYGYGRYGYGYGYGYGDTSVPTAAPTPAAAVVPTAAVPEDAPTAEPAAAPAQAEPAKSAPAKKAPADAKPASARAPRSTTKK